LVCAGAWFRGVDAVSDKGGSAKKSMGNRDVAWKI